MANLSKIPTALLVAAAVAMAAIVSSANAHAQEDATAPPAESRKKHAAKLTENSTLAEWKAAGTSARSEVAVAIARKKLPPTATKLEVATAAMEISGCLTKTAGDARFDGWKVEPTATTCLTAPERPAQNSGASK